MLQRHSPDSTLSLFLTLFSNHPPQQPALNHAVPQVIYSVQCCAVTFQGSGAHCRHSCSGLAGAVLQVGWPPAATSTWLQAAAPAVPACPVGSHRPPGGHPALAGWGTGRAGCKSRNMGRHARGRKRIRAAGAAVCRLRAQRRMHPCAAGVGQPTHAAEAEDAKAELMKSCNAPHGSSLPRSWSTTRPRCRCRRRLACSPAVEGRKSALRGETTWAQ